MAAVSLTARIGIAPVDEVGAFSASPDDAPTWCVIIKSVEWQTVPPVAVGSRIVLVAQFWDEAWHTAISSLSPFQTIGVGGTISNVIWSSKLKTRGLIRRFVPRGCESTFSKVYHS